MLEKCAADGCASTPAPAGGRRRMPTMHAPPWVSALTPVGDPHGEQTRNMMMKVSNTPTHVQPASLCIQPISATHPALCAHSLHDAGHAITPSRRLVGTSECTAHGGHGPNANGPTVGDFHPMHAPRTLCATNDARPAWAARLTGGGRLGGVDARSRDARSRSVVAANNTPEKHTDAHAPPPRGAPSIADKQKCTPELKLPGRMRQAEQNRTTRHDRTRAALHHRASLRV